MANIVHVPYPGASSCQGLCGLKIYNPAVPVRQNIGCLYPGKMIFINGTPTQDSKRFTVNLKSEKKIAFHLDVRFDFGNDTNVIVRNSNVEGEMGTPEKTLTAAFPFNRNSSFEMIILVEPSCFKVAVNNEHVLEFNHRFPVEKVDHLRIKGDVKVSMVRIQG